jgi:hypothetical protein
MTRRIIRRRREVHVFRDGASGQWVVARAGRRRSRHRRQATAVRKARPLARRYRVDVNTHGRNGRIRSKSSYGNESPRRDRDR